MIINKIKTGLKKIFQTDAFIMLLGLIAGILLLANLWFSSYTFLKEDNLVKMHMEKIDKIEDRLVQLESQLNNAKTQEVE